MWPWEHLSVGYLLYSGVSRLLNRRPPARAGALAVAVGTQFPDLVDKPGSWVFGVLPSGTSVAHSVFVAVPVSLAAVVVARRLGRPEIGLAFGLGYLSHLPCDIFFYVLIGRDPAYGLALWPLSQSHAGGTEAVVPLVTQYFWRYADYLVSPAGVGYLLLEALLLTTALAVWVADGTPGRETVRWLGDALRARLQRG